MIPETLRKATESINYNSDINNEDNYIDKVLNTMDGDMFNNAVKHAMDQYNETSTLFTDYFKGDEFAPYNKDPFFKRYIEAFDDINQENRAVYDRTIYVEVLSKVASMQINLFMSGIGKSVQGVNQLLQATG